MMLEKYPNLKKEVRGSIPGVRSPLYLTKYLPGGQLPPMLWRWFVGLLAQQQINKQENGRTVRLCPLL